MTSVYYLIDSPSGPASEAGEWFAAVHENSVLVVEIKGEPLEKISRLDVLWKSLAVVNGIQATLDELTRRGLSATEQFALVSWSSVGGHSIVKAFVRGTIALTVHEDAGETSVDGTDVSTWLEKQFSGVRKFDLNAGPAMGHVSHDDVKSSTRASASMLPLYSGVVKASSVIVDLEGVSQVSAVSSAPYTVLAPVPPVVESSASNAVPSNAGPSNTGPSKAGPSNTGPSNGWVDPEATVTSMVWTPDVEAASNENQSAETQSSENQSAEAQGDEAQGDEAQGAEAPGAEFADPAESVVPADPTGNTEDSSYDYLFGETVFRTVQDAAVRDEAERDEADRDEADRDGAKPSNGKVPADANSDDANSDDADHDDADHDDAVHDDADHDDGDHDGHTIVSADIAKLRARRHGLKQQQSEAPAEPVAPTLYLELANGSRELLTQPILVGRAPSVSKVSAGQLPRLVTVNGPDQDISRNHAQFAVEGGTVVVTDLHSRNGTTVVLPGRAPQQLRQGEPTSVIVGTVIDLGGGVTFTVGEE